MKVEELLVESVPTAQLLSKLGKPAVISYKGKADVLGGKKNPMTGRVTKIVSNLPVILCGNGGEYEKAKRAESGDDTYVSGPLPWGTRNADGLIEHKGITYVQYMVTGRGDRTQYFLDGNPIAKEDIDRLKPTVTPADTSSKIMLRVTDIENLISVN